MYIYKKIIQDLYEINYEILMKEIKEHLNIWRDVPCAWIGRQYFQVVSSFQLNR